MTRCRQRADQEDSEFVSDAELKGLISTAYGELTSILTASGMRYFESEQEITTIADTYATGTLVCVAKASLVDGETFTLHDGYGPLTFEFDVDGSGVLVQGNVRINVSSDTSATEVGARAETAIDAATHADGTSFRISATNSAGTVALIHDATGFAGNQQSFDSVANTGFSITDMRGGGGSYSLPPNYLSTVGVEYVVSTATNERRPLSELMVQERHQFSGRSGTAMAYSIKGHQIFLHPNPTAGQRYVHTYAPQAVDLSSTPTAAVIDVVTPDGEEFIVAHVALKILTKEEAEQGLLVSLKDDRNDARARLHEWAVLRALNSPRRPVLEGFSDVFRDEGEFWPR